MQLDREADSRWIAQRVVSLLSHYFVAEIHPAAMEKVASDWTRQLELYPEWAIEAACDWWVSRHNPKRRQKPVPGDIADRANTEAAIIRIARSNLALFEKYGTNPPSFVSAGKGK